MKCVFSTVVTTLISFGIVCNAQAQDGLLGIAFVQAPEMGGGVAVDTDMERAFDKATEECMSNGAEARDCLRANWCQPAGWSVDLFLQHEEGVHWHEVVCGFATEAIARAAVANLCDTTDRSYIVACLMVQLYDPKGTEMMDN
ncbi:MAG: hypothetical protein AAFP99_04595 [Pseudomonadota bacterium]